MLKEDSAIFCPNIGFSSVLQLHKWNQNYSLCHWFITQCRKPHMPCPSLLVHSWTAELLPTPSLLVGLPVSCDSNWTDCWQTSSLRIGMVTELFEVFSNPTVAGWWAVGGSTAYKEWTWYFSFLNPLSISLNDDFSHGLRISHLFYYPVNCSWYFYQGTFMQVSLRWIGYGIGYLLGT